MLTISSAYNYERDASGDCKLVAGLTLPEASAVCKDPFPGFEEDFQKKHGIGGFSLFLAIVLPFAAAGGVGYYVWKHWDGKFGRIRLGDGSGSGAFDSDAPWVKWPIAAVSGLVAVISALPLLVGSVYRWAAGRMGGGGG